MTYVSNPAAFAATNEANAISGTGQGVEATRSLTQGARPREIGPSLGDAMMVNLFSQPWYGDAQNDPDNPELNNEAA